ncbi:uncharacterized protein LOC124596117 [Schistocerca americana]|uniref:uncharacterized protein LOC124596117 n=1 Tax=Schistocerca americana TaxID=7009 RepID=UPI001F4F1E2A|nr:uncharacterized protein LOC124596117 [Schistocerca americana]
MSAVPVVSATGAASAVAPATPTSCKFRLTLARKVHRIKKMLKPVLEMVHKHCRKSSRRSPPCSQAFEEEESPADQNAANEALEQRLAEELRAGAAAAGSGAAIAVWCDGRVRLRQVAATQGQVGDVAVPASFLTTSQGGLCWVTPDADILLLDGSHESQGLAAEQQVPAAAALLSTPSSSQETLSVHSF